MTDTALTSASRVRTHDAERTSTAHRRRAVLAAQVIASLGLAAGGTAGGLLAESITGSTASAAAPLGALVLGAGFSAPPIARVMARRGRTAGLLAGYGAGAVGAALVILAAAATSLPMLLAGTAVLGAGTTAVMLSRYVVAELSPADERGQAISRSLLAVTAGAVLGPNLLGPTGAVATAVGLPAPTGLFLLAVTAFAVAPALLLFATRRR